MRAVQELTVALTEILETGTTACAQSRLTSGGIPNGRHLDRKELTFQELADMMGYPATLKGQPN